MKPLHKPSFTPEQARRLMHTYGSTYNAMIALSETHDVTEADIWNALPCDGKVKRGDVIK